MIAEAKRSNLIISADFNNTNNLLECADCKPLPALDTYKVIDQNLLKHWALISRCSKHTSTSSVTLATQRLPA